MLIMYLFFILDDNFFFLSNSFQVTSYVQVSRRIDDLAKQWALISIYEKPESDFNHMLGLFDDKLKHLGATTSQKLGNALYSQL